MDRGFQDVDVPSYFSSWPFPGIPECLSGQLLMGYDSWTQFHIQKTLVVGWNGTRRATDSMFGSADFGKVEPRIK